MSNQFPSVRLGRFECQIPSCDKKCSPPEIKAFRSRLRIKCSTVSKDTVRKALKKKKGRIAIYDWERRGKSIVLGWPGSEEKSGMLVEYKIGPAVLRKIEAWARR